MILLFCKVHAVQTNLAYIWTYVCTASKYSKCRLVFQVNIYEYKQLEQSSKLSVSCLSLRHLELWSDRSVFQADTETSFHLVAFGCWAQVIMRTSGGDLTMLRWVLQSSFSRSKFVCLFVFPEDHPIWPVDKQMSFYHIDLSEKDPLSGRKEINQKEGFKNVIVTEHM